MYVKLPYWGFQILLLGLSHQTIDKFLGFGPVPKKTTHQVKNFTL